MTCFLNNSFVLFPMLYLFQRNYSNNSNIHSDAIYQQCSEMYWHSDGISSVSTATWWENTRDACCGSLLLYSARSAECKMKSLEQSSILIPFFPLPDGVCFLITWKAYMCGHD